MKVSMSTSVQEVFLRNLTICPRNPRLVIVPSYYGPSLENPSSRAQRKRLRIGMRDDLLINQYYLKRTGSSAFMAIAEQRPGEEEPGERSRQAAGIRGCEQG